MACIRNRHTVQLVATMAVLCAWTGDALCMHEEPPEFKSLIMHEGGVVLHYRWFLALLFLGSLPVVRCHHIGLRLSRDRGMAPLYFGSYGFLCFAGLLFSQWDHGVFSPLFPILSKHTLFRLASAACCLSMPFLFKLFDFRQQGAISLLLLRLFQLLAILFSLAILGTPLPMARLIFIAFLSASLLLSGVIITAHIKDGGRRWNTDFILFSGGMVFSVFCAGIVLHGVKAKIFANLTLAGFICFMALQFLVVIYHFTKMLLDEKDMPIIPEADKESTIPLAGPADDETVAAAAFIEPVHWEENNFTILKKHGGISHLPDARGILGAAANDRRRTTILVVDDDKTVLRMVTDYLSLGGITSLTASNGREALEILSAGQIPDLVLLDILMPEIDGYEVCRRLRAKYSASELPVIMLTGLNFAAKVVEGFKAGANDYLTKPFTLEELTARIQCHLKLKEAYLTIEENVRLQRELTRRIQAENDLLLAQKRLLEMLNAVEDSLICITKSEKICFCNRPCQELLGYEAQDLLGRTVWSLFPRDTAQDVRSSLANLPKPTAHAGIVRNHEEICLQGKAGEMIPLHLLITFVAFEDETLRLFFLRQPLSMPGEKENPCPPEQNLALIHEVNQGRDRLQSLVARLHDGARGMEPRAAAILSDLKIIDRTLEELGRTLMPSEKNGDRRRLATTVMNLALEYWIQSTGATKFDLARRSGLWTVYTNPDGWERAQTLDRYLDAETLPRKIRWRQIAATADFVLNTCDKPSSLREQLESTLLSFRLTGFNNR